MVYGGGTRNIADGKVKRCQFFEDLQREDLELLRCPDESLNMSLVSQSTCSRYALITFADKGLV